MSGDRSEEMSLFTRPAQHYTEPSEQQDSSPEEELASARGGTQDTGLYQNAGECAASNGHGLHNDRKENGGKPRPESPCAIPPFDELLGTTHEAAMQVIGFGRLQWLLYIVLGLAMMGDGIELLMMAYILPGAEHDFCMTAPMKGWLGSIAFAGMIIGALIWGNLADKVGRKVTLISSLCVNACFALAGAFMPSYSLFFLCRLLSGIGIGGSIPIVMAYGGELSERDKRGWRMCVLLVSWAAGGVYCSALGWLIIPNKDFEFSVGTETMLSSWRAFILISVIPVVLSIIGLFMMPESPRFLLQVGQDLEALTIYRKLYLWNHSYPGAEYEMPEIELPCRMVEDTALESDDKEHGLCDIALIKINKFLESFIQLFYTPLTLTTFILMLLWFCISFGYYGISIWFPEYIKRMQEESYYADTNETMDTTYENVIFRNKLENMYFTSSAFHNVTFKDIQIIHVTFDMCSFMHCTFENVTSRQTYFIESVVINSTFTKTNFFASRFHGTLLENTVFVDTDTGCDVDFDYNHSQRLIFLETFVSQIAVLPATILTAFLLNQFGRVPVLVVCLLSSGISVFFIWATNTEIAVVCLNAIFNCLINGAFNCIDVTSTEQYPTHLRATAFGFLSSLGRIAAILGNVTFGNLIDVSKAIPILITAFVLFSGGLTAISLPESKSKIM